MSGHGLLNIEATAAVFFLLCLLVRARGGTQRTGQPGGDVSFRTDLVPVLVLAGVTIAAFGPNLTAPLLHDSYGQLYAASQQSFVDVLRVFYTHPTRGDFFFRPLADLMYWLFFRVAGYAPAAWHGASLLLHIANCALVYLLARRVGLGVWAAVCAGGVFALHPSRPEAVAWAAAWFDLFATFFALTALLCAERWAATERTRWLVWMAAAGVAGVLSKESAYTLPLLVWLVGWLRTGRLRPRRAAWLSFAICALAFGYRYWVIGSIGGYGAAAGRPTIFEFSAIRTLNALFFRMWALLAFPIDWAEAPGPMLWAAFGGLVLAALGLLLRARVLRNEAAAAVALTIAAVLPAEHLLLIGTDLNGARVLYLPVLGAALLCGFAMQALPMRAGAAIATGIFFFQITALEHNLRLWRETARLSAEACEFIADATAESGSRPVAVTDLPYKHVGVYFLSNGFAPCVMAHSRGRWKTLPPVEANSETAVRVYRWNDERTQFERLR